ncbi:rubredoxin [Mesorhizobium loti]|uniref:Rubredoxin n=1 Tax=Rhizobium loti TaxID=381 RepID=A0A124GGR1_RHILI|nr:rubredoxin [Mesorhizobium loti]
MSAFENLRKHETLSDDGRTECGIRWRLCDRADGAPVSQIPPGTPFLALPRDWRSPNCDALLSKFVRLGDGD